MSSARSLLKRIEHPEPAGTRNLPGDAEELMDAVRLHLQQMLNSRRGNALTVPDYGTSDFSDFFRGYDSIQRIKEEIHHTIEKYEPRLAHIEVTYAPRENDPFSMHFDIVASLVTEDQQTPTVFRTVVEGSGEVKVKHS